VLSRAQIAELIPHAGAMVLLDAVVEHDADGIRCRSQSHRCADNPLRRDGRLHALAGVEYGGQAAALHGPLQAGGAGSAAPGLVVSVREVRWQRRYLDDVAGTLEVTATCQLRDARQLAYGFRLSDAAGTTLVAGEIGILLP